MKLSFALFTSRPSKEARASRFEELLFEHVLSDSGAIPRGKPVTPSNEFFEENARKRSAMLITQIGFPPKRRMRRA